RGEDTYLYRAMRKYGLQNFSVQEVNGDLTREQADRYERLWILLLQATNRKFGYMATEGGNGYYNPNQETRQKKSAKMKAKYNAGFVHPKFNSAIKNEDIIKLHSQGIPERKIADILGVARSFIKSRFRQLGLKPRPVGKHEGYVHSEERRKKM